MVGVFISHFNINTNLGKIVVVNNVKRDLKRDFVRVYLDDNLTTSW
jgi:hypothetical protein